MKRYGADKFWCFIEDDNKEVAVWTKVENGDLPLCRCHNKYYAMEVVDALILKDNTLKDRGITAFGPKERCFLDFLIKSGIEPHATMAANSILWNDWDAYKRLRDTFSEFYK